MPGAEFTFNCTAPVSRRLIALAWMCKACHTKRSNEVGKTLVDTRLEKDKKSGSVPEETFVKIETMWCT